MVSGRFVSRGNDAAAPIKTVFQAPFVFTGCRTGVLRSQTMSELTQSELQIARARRRLARKRVAAILRLFYRMAVRWLWTERVRLRFCDEPAAREAIRLKMWRALGERYRAAALALGGLLIKGGQLLSTRGDLFPVAFTSALSSLQDEVPPVPFEAVRGVIEAEFGDRLERIFATFDPVPLAAASLGQVHRATLPDGAEVVVKVLRPGVDELIRADLEGFRQVVRRLLRWTEWAKAFDLAGVFFESCHILLRELDLREEARHTQRFAAMFNPEAGGHPRIVVPHVHESYTRQRVLTLSYFPGISVKDRQALVEAGVDPIDVAKLLVHALSRQVLVDGFFHADPHPGNILVVPGDAGVKLVLIDFGMVGQLTPRQRRALKRVGVGVVRKDPDAIVMGLDELAVLRPGADRAALSRTIAWLFDKQLQGEIFTLKPEQFLEVVQDLRALVYSAAFQFPSDIAFLGRGASTQFGVCRMLDPDGKFLDEVAVAAAEHLSVSRELGVWSQELRQDLLRLPARLDAALKVLERGSGHPFLGHGLTPGRAARAGLPWDAIAAVLWLGGILWWGFGSVQMAIACWILAGLALAWLALMKLPPVPLEP
jgi:predicted unusual protein kinase regulating ubiquinone biosynthesis (AarF/ABC1/UbiB family)